MCKIVEMAGRLLRVEKVQNIVDIADIPTGKRVKDTKEREKIISEALKGLDKIYCPAMDSYVYFNLTSRREIKEHSSKSFKSTVMALNIKGLLERAVYVGELPQKKNSAQRKVKKMHFLIASLNDFGPAKITIGEYKQGKLIQYCVTCISDERGK